MEARGDLGSITCPERTRGSSLHKLLLTSGCILGEWPPRDPPFPRPTPGSAVVETALGSNDPKVKTLIPCLMVPPSHTTGPVSYILILILCMEWSRLGPGHAVGSYWNPNLTHVNYPQALPLPEEITNRAYRLFATASNWRLQRCLAGASFSYP